MNVPQVTSGLHIAPADPPVRFTIGSRPIETTRTLKLPPIFVDRCRKAFHSVRFEGETRVLGVTSARPGEGKTSIAAGLSLAIAADTGEPTILVECDLERPSFAHMFAIDGSPGLAEWVEGGLPLRAALMSPTDNAYVVPGGGTGDDSTRVVYQMGQSEFVDGLAAQFKNVILDLPPMLSASSGQLAAKLAERILLVARYGVTTTPDLEQAVELAGPGRIAGVVLNAYAPRLPTWLRRLG